MEPEPPWTVFAILTIITVLLVLRRLRAWRRARRERGRFRLRSVRSSATLVSLGTAVVAALFASDRWSLSALASWFVGVNIAAIVWFGLDKLASLVSARRVPESTLHTMAAVGGSPGALVGMDLFRHKTIKPSFNKTMGRVVFVQIVLVLVYLSMRNGT